MGSFGFGAGAAFLFELFPSGLCGSYGVSASRFIMRFAVSITAASLASVVSGADAGGFVGFLRTSVAGLSWMVGGMLSAAGRRDSLGESLVMFGKLWQRFTTIKDPWGINIRFYACVGVLAAEWSRVEFLLAVLIFLAIDVEPGKGEFLLANLGFQSRIHLLNAELHIYREIGASEEMVSEIERALKELNELYPKRNYYVHSFYVDWLWKT